MTWVLHSPSQRPRWQLSQALIWQLQGPPPALRQQARQLLREILVDTLGTANDTMAVDFTAGQAPRVNERWQGHPVAISISYADDRAWVALCPGQRLGLDVCTVASLPDWQTVARLYLGPSTAQQLAALSTDTRDTAFAQAWAELEARGKCLGLGLQEWTPALQLALYTPSIRCDSWLIRPASSGPSYAVAVALAPA